MELSPQNIVDILDKHIVGQKNAKKVVARALRSRWRRLQLDEELREEVTPKNILMIGSTGVGKTEIARRLAKLDNAPFIKVEATKFTEVGYVGRDVESIIRDLLKSEIRAVKKLESNKIKDEVEQKVEEEIIDILIKERKKSIRKNSKDEEDNEDNEDKVNVSEQRQLFRKELRQGDLNEREININVKSLGSSVEIMGPPGMEEITDQLQGMLEDTSRRSKKKKLLKIKDAKKILCEGFSEDMLDISAVEAQAIENIEQKGIVFLDEVDKITSNESSRSSDVSRAGVQRDLLSLIEGTEVSTRHGVVKTDHILFIASGAFHLSKPSDLIPELQGRLPVRVELDALTPKDFEDILLNTKASIITQYTALMQTEGVELVFDKEAIKLIAEYAYKVNETVENIGARRLHTMVEALLEDVSFNATEMGKNKDTAKVDINSEYVKDKLSSLVKDPDLSQYIL